MSAKVIRYPYGETLERCDAKAFITAIALVANNAPAQAYRSGDRCPGCGESAWLIGRITAECSKCGYALPLKESNR